MLHWWSLCDFHCHVRLSSCWICWCYARMIWIHLLLNKNSSIELHCAIHRLSLPTTSTSLSPYLGHSRFCCAIERPWLISLAPFLWYCVVKWKIIKPPIDGSPFEFRHLTCKNRVVLFCLYLTVLSRYTLTSLSQKDRQQTDRRHTIAEHCSTNCTVWRKTKLDC